MLTISQLASYAGVTTRAVRHYHAKGLLPEPERDHSGYRRYDAQAAVSLIRIRILADAGVPLARVQELLRADQEEFTAAVAEIERDSWILTLAVLSPEQVAEAMALKGRLLDDPEFVGTMRSIGEAGDWAPDDPRLPGLADQVATVLDRHATWSGGSASELEAGLVDLFDSIALDSLPVGRRLEALLQERGWSGWTRQERVAR
jgi:DNA-binding transcriptional MerR regulator